MRKGMPSARPLRALLAATAATVAVLLPGTAAAADEAAGPTVVGRLVQTWSEAGRDPAGLEHADAPLSWIETGQGAVRIPANDLAGVPAGSTVAVTLGGETADPATAEGVEPARDVLEAQVLSQASAAPLPARRITNQVTVALVAPQGSAPDGVTLQQVVGSVDGPVADFWAAQSDGAISVGVTATHDWV